MYVNVVPQNFPSHFHTIHTPRGPQLLKLTKNWPDKSSQVAQQQAAPVAPARTFPGQSQPNLKGHANAITLQSGTELGGPTEPRVEKPAVVPQNFPSHFT